jgi:hypothetical protein
MKKSECERGIKSLSIDWFATLSMEKQEHPSFYDFKRWLEANGHQGYLNFRSRMGADYDAELWFDQVLKQSWRR